MVLGLGLVWYLCPAVDKPLIAVLGLSCPPEPHGFNVGHFPLIKIVSASPLPPIPQANWAFWSSKQAIGLYVDVIRKQNGLKHAVLGQAEALALKACNLSPDWISPEATGLASAKLFVASLTPPQTLWWPCAAQANPAIAQTLETSGHTLMQTVVYDTVTCICTRPDKPVKAWLFTSPSTVRAYKDNMLADDNWQLLPGQKVGALGPTTAQAIRELLGVNPYVAQPSGNWTDILTKLA